MNCGQHGRAEELCRSLLRENPQDVSILGLHGAVLIKLNRFGEAEVVLRRTNELVPTFAKPWEDLGFVLHETGRFDEAADVLRNAVRLDPSLELAWMHLGKSLARLGDGKGADEAFEKAFDLNPVRRKLALAGEQHKLGNLEEAERLYR